MWDLSPKTTLDFALYGLLAFSTLVTIILVTLPSQYDPYSTDFAKDEVVDDTKKVMTPAEYVNRRTWVKQTRHLGASFQVVVLGDIGRSPRMQYHAISIAKNGGQVQLVGYTESELHPDVVSNSSIKVVPIDPSPAWLQAPSKLLFPLVAPLKVLWQAWSLYYAMGYDATATKWMLVQNPPSIPTLAIAYFVCFLRNTDFVIDWHNFGYSILALKLGRRHPLVLVSRLYENIFARSAIAHLAVTDAMATVLKQKYGIKAQVLHDRPAALFKPLNPEERANYLSQLPETAQYAKDLLSGFMRLVVSSTSWTADEDFSLLLEALTRYSALVTSKTGLPKVLAIITGKGPLKEHYLNKIRALNQKNQLLNVLLLTAWLTPEDYALLLGSADLGVSLHTSSSGVDLPMKVVDMFGAGLPVVGWSKFQAWPELVQEGVNGRGFETAQQLSDLFVELFGKDVLSLRKLKDGALIESERRWDEEWDGVAGKLFLLVKQLT
ncbi:beta-1,4-mannosyltransferas-like protein [Lophium mytilinum]|uniref:Chitobiosyldiphosphodolichol beta-mannosyltransferase n=1 Tax=Lophium mytilinum TaxID=390894 RepID=A0A6A6QRK7_9PEZI|nr:beta-1,4-mannosyltransferas-like protein [Lophium mytilinum]